MMCVLYKCVCLCVIPFNLFNFEECADLVSFHLVKSLCKTLLNEYVCGNKILLCFYLSLNVRCIYVSIYEIVQLSNLVPQYIHYIASYNTIDIPSHISLMHLKLYFQVLKYSRWWLCVFPCSWSIHCVIHI